MDLALLSAKLDAANTLEDIQRLLVEIEYQLEVYASQSEIARYKQLAMFQVNDFSATATAKNVEETKIKVLHFLSTLNMQWIKCLNEEITFFCQNK